MAKAEKSKGSNKSNGKAEDKIKKKVYEAELERLQLELVKLQEYIREEGLKVVVVFEGRDAGGQGRCDQAYRRGDEPEGGPYRRATGPERP